MGGQSPQRAKEQTQVQAVTHGLSDAIVKDDPLASEWLSGTPSGWLGDSRLSCCPNRADHAAWFFVRHKLWLKQTDSLGGIDEASSGGGCQLCGSMICGFGTRRRTGEPGARCTAVPRRAAPTAPFMLESG